MPTLHGTHTEAEKGNATPRHIGRDESVQGTSGAFLSTHFWTSNIGILFFPPFLHLTHIYIPFIPNLHIIIYPIVPPQFLTHIGVGRAHTIAESCKYARSPCGPWEYDRRQTSP